MFESYLGKGRLAFAVFVSPTGAKYCLHEQMLRIQGTTCSIKVPH